MRHQHLVSDFEGPLEAVVREKLRARPKTIPNIYKKGEHLIIGLGEATSEGATEIITSKSHPIGPEKACNLIFSNNDYSELRGWTMSELLSQLELFTKDYVCYLGPLRMTLQQDPRQVQHFVREAIRKTLEIDLPNNLDINPSLVQIQEMVSESQPPVPSDRILLPVSRLEELKREVTKRLIINMIFIQGAAGEMFARFLSRACEGDFQDLGITADLAGAAKRFFNMQNFCHLLLEVDSTDGVRGPHKSAGRVQLTREGDMTVIKVSSIDPLLAVYECLKGIFEVVATHGLPADGEIRRAVLEVCDKEEFEGIHIPLGQIIFCDIFTETRNQDLIRKVHMIATDSMAGIKAVLEGYLDE